MNTAMGYSMFKRAHHQRIHQILQTINQDFFTQAECYFGGGTAITLALDEYRESVDIDFLCASSEGYRILRSAVFNSDLKELFTTPPHQLRETRADRYGIRTVLSVADTPIKFEIIHEDRIDLQGKYNPILGVPMLIKEDLFCEKLLANTDRFADKASGGRDIIDLAMMIDAWGKIPASAWEKAYQAYGASVKGAHDKACEQFQRPGYFDECLRKLNIDPDQYKHKISKALNLSPQMTNWPAP